MFTDEVVVVANGSPPSPALFNSCLEKGQTLVALDGGGHVCDTYQIEPALLLGDFDSISPSLLKKFSHIPQIHTPDQSKCDLEKGLEYLFAHSVKRIVVLGALGKRVDHSLTNIALLSRYPNLVRFETENEICFALPKKISVPCDVGQTLSLLPQSSLVRGVSTKGLKWELNGTDLSNKSVAVSNIAMVHKVEITYEEGDILICLNR